MHKTRCRELQPGITFRVYDIGYEMDRLYDLVPGPDAEYR